MGRNATIGSVVVAFRATTDDYVKGAARVKQTNKEVNQSLLGDVKDTFGRGGAFTQFAKLAKGGGAILGLSLAASELNKLTQNAEKFAVALDKGDGSARGVAADFLKSVPIVGSLGESLSRVFELVNGTTLYAAAMKAETEQQEQRIKWIGELKKASADYHAQTAKELAEGAASIKKLTLSGLPLKLFEIDQSFKDDLAKIKDDLAKLKSSAPFKEHAEKLRETDTAELEKWAKARNEALDIQANSPNRRFRIDAADALKHANEEIDQIQRRQAKDRELVARESAKAESDSYWKELTAGIHRGAEAFQAASLFVSEKQRKAKEDAQKYIESGQSPFTKYAADAKEIDRLQKAGALTIQQANEARSRAMEENFHTFDALKDKIKDQIAATVEWAKANKKMADEARTPYEKLIDTLKDLQKRRGGIFGLGDENYRRLAARARDEYAQQVKSMTPTVVDARFPTVNNPNTQSVQDDILKADQQQATTLDTIANMIRNNPLIRIFR